MLASPRAWPLVWQAAIVLAAAGMVYWLMLGSSGFAFSEGQRVIPGWDMARSGDWLVPRLFEQPYLRKPPGMPWAVALASYVFGENEFSARSVSAMSMTLASLLSFWFATRWFGRPWGLVAGLAHVLTPLFWLSPTSPVGRSAEIEALHNLFAQASMLIVVELLVVSPKAWAGALWGLALSGAVAGMMLVKGPSGLPCLGGAALGVCVTLRSVRSLRNPWFWSGLAVACGVVGLVAWKVFQRVQQLPEPPVTEPPSRFLWRDGAALGVLTLPFATLLAALPTSLALPLAFRAARAGAPEDRFARALAWSCVVSLLIYTIVGVSNNRYAMPALGVLPCLMGFVLRRHFEEPARPRWARLLMDRPWAWGAGLFIGAIASLFYTEHRRAEHTSGKPAGLALGEVLDDSTQVWANALMDNRPEVLYYARQRAKKRGHAIRVRWVPADHAGQGDLPMPPRGSYIVLLEGPELSAYERAGLLGGMHEVFHGQAHKFLFRVFQNR